MADRRWPALVLTAALLLVGCAAPGHETDIAGSYRYEKDGCGGAFTVDINSDGTFSYYEGWLSSYIGNGEWELDGDTLILREKISKYSSAVNRFHVDEGDLVFLSENSSNFMYVTVSEGDRFSKALQSSSGE